MKIVVDGFGGDNAPVEILKGCALAVQDFGVQILVTGDERKLADVAIENGINMKDITVMHADSVITMEDDPMSIMKDKADSSLARAFELLKDDAADALVASSNTGAVVVGGNMIAGRIRGVKRAALGTFFPGRKGDFLLMDIGANVECRPEMLVQFGVMGSAYVSGVKGVNEPTVGLLNNGTESHKGTELQQEAYKLFQNAPVNFYGNVEGSDINHNVCDIVVTDGFTGNVVLKLSEGLSGALFGIIKDTLTSRGLMTKLGAALIKPALSEMKALLDPNEHGGVPLLGTKKPVIKAHGSSNAYAFRNAILRAKEFHEANVIENIETGIAKLREDSKK